MNKKEKLLRGIKDNKQSMWIWIIFGILTFWTIIGAIIGVIGAFWCHELKSQKEIKLELLK